jgi:hypothetical protein
MPMKACRANMLTCTSLDSVTMSRARPATTRGRQQPCRPYAHPIPRKSEKKRGARALALASGKWLAGFVTLALFGKGSVRSPPTEPNGTVLTPKPNVLAQRLPDVKLGLERTTIQHSFSIHFGWPPFRLRVRRQLLAPGYRCAL